MSNVGSNNYNLLYENNLFPLLTRANMPQHTEKNRGHLSAARSEFTQQCFVPFLQSLSQCGDCLHIRPLNSSYF